MELKFVVPDMAETFGKLSYAGEKDFDQDQPLKAVNPHLVAKGYEIENRGFTDYVLYVDDLVKE